VEPPRYENPGFRLEPQFIALSAPLEGSATHYGVAYAGQTMACGGSYVPDDSTIVAVSLARDAEWNCGTYLEICGTLACMRVIRQDSCPACLSTHVDLSEAGITLVCGDQAHYCDVTIQPLLMVLPPEASPPPATPPGSEY
jgi:hypothetical protein